MKPKQHIYVETKKGRKSYTSNDNQMKVWSA